MNQLVSVIPAALVLLAPHAAAAPSRIGVWKTTDAVVSGGRDAGRRTSDIRDRKAQATKVVDQAADRVVGTWELNLAKSTFTTAPPKSSTRTYEAVPNGLKFVGREVDAAGQTVLGQWTAYYDGEDYPTTGSPHSDTISIKRIDSFTGESIQKKAGKVVTRNHRVISSNGKIMTLTAAGTDAKGQPFTNVLVFDRR
jgi:hypothetical protein